MSDAHFRIPTPVNEPVFTYGPGCPHKAAVKEQIKSMTSETTEIPLIIGGKEVRTDTVVPCVVPHDHGTILAQCHQAGEAEVTMAIEAAHEARKEWSKMDWQDRCTVFLKAANILAGPRRAEINAATMLNQSKTIFQSEIDAVCEMADFLRFNCYYASQIYAEQPMYSPSGMWNRLEYRPLEGFVFAVTPFNFASIAGNLPAAPAIVGNVALWKPASSTIFSAYYTMRVFEEAGLPDGVINFIPGSGRSVGPLVMQSPDLAGIHFTGSTAVFQNMWKTVGENIASYKSYPRIVGETGGKDFIFAHGSADTAQLATALVRGAFEYQGQKCSAVSRAYIPTSIWSEVKEKMLAQLETIKMGSPEDFTNFMTAVIDKAAYESITGYVDFLKETEDAEVIFGGGYDGSKGYFIEPTVAVTTDPRSRTMAEEIFGPVLTIYVYEDSAFDDTLVLCDTTSPYALTGAIFARDRQVIAYASDKLRNAAGNFYINDKPTGAVVGQQPFGGSRASGTNDKAGGYLNMIRWVSARTIKETFSAPVDYRYPFMKEA